MYLVQVLPFLALCAAILKIAVADGPEGRLFDGQPVDNFRQFPHHVYINVIDYGRKCGGTILSNRWVLTSASCVKHGSRIDLSFRKQQQFNIRADFFSISVNRDHVFVYPTNYDDIALIKIPTILDFSESLSSVNISRLSIEALRDRFTVMPGFSDFMPQTSTSTTMQTTTARTTTYQPPTPGQTTSGIPEPPSPSTTLYPQPSTPAATPPNPDVTPPHVGISMDEKHFENGNMGDILRYGMFSVIDNRICKKKLGSDFDEYTQLCVNSWGDNPNRPCESDYGSGLIVGWPARSEIVGLFSMSSPGCDSQLPAVFTFIGKYVGWIEGMMRG